MSPRIRNLLMTTSALLALGTVPGAAGPDGPVVVGGTATVSGTGTSSVIVNQTTQRAIINWNTFNLGTGDTTRFNQPNSSSVVLNRVTGGLGASTIDGVLSANGRVFIINRDGILFGNNATINTASFLATTHDIRNQNFMAGRMNFNIPGRSDASIVNLGHITAQTGGFAALVAPGVRNSGTITATLGTVALASGNMFTLDMYGDRLIQLGVNDAIAAQVIDVQTGQPLNSLVTNAGRLKANGGRVELTAVAARAVVDSVINNKGVIEANSIGMHDGKIVLGGATKSSKGKGAPKQTVMVSGKLLATGESKGSKGGTVLITGEDIQFAGAMIDASGYSGGGKVMIGGDWGGGHPDKALVDNPSAQLEPYKIANATTVSVDDATRIDASAKTHGNGGKVILWSDSLTTFAGTIFARGGASDGNGGFVETSGHQLAFSGTVDTRAPHGPDGTLLLDPYDVTISANPSISPPTFSPDGTWTPTDNGSNINVTDLHDQLHLGNVVITTNGTGSESGNITFQASLSGGSGNHSLTLSAHNNINIAPGVVLRNTGSGNLVLRADSDGSGTGTVRFLNCDCSGPGPGLGEIDFSSSTGKVSIYYNPPWGYSSPTDYSPHVLTNGAIPNQLTAYMLVNTTSNLGNIATNLSGNYALGRDIDGNAPGNSNKLDPIGTVYPAIGSFTGLFDGQNHSISNLNISTSTAGINTVGLFGSIGNNGIVRNLNLSNINVLANSSATNQFVGTLAGESTGTISNVTVSGSVSNNGVQSSIIAGGLVGQVQGHGTVTQSTAAVNVTVGDAVDGMHENNAGGLVGFLSGSSATISNSSASGIINGGSHSNLGGLAGRSDGTITQSSATGAVNVNLATGIGNTAGGLVGFNFGTISFSTASGAVSGASSNVFQAANLGGLVGINDATGTIANSSATGAVIGGPGSSSGGLAGSNNGMISQSNAAGQVSSADNNAGGLVGFNIGTVSSSFATGAVSGGGQSIGGFVGENQGAITSSHATGAVSGNSGATVGGFVGQNSSGATISNSHATGAVTLTASGAVDQLGGGFVGDNEGQITNSYATGAVKSTGGDTMLGGFAGANSPGGVITNSYATGNVTISGATLAFAGGFVGGNAGSIDPSYATGNVSVDGLVAAAGGFAGLNLGDISLSYATGAVMGGDHALLGGFVGLNAGTINQAYARGAVVGGAHSFVGGFVGVDVGISLKGFGGLPGEITQAYALGPTTGGLNSVAAAFAAFNLGSLDQVYGVGLVTGGAGSTTGGLVAVNNFNVSSLLGQFNVLGPFNGAQANAAGSSQLGTTTDSYWDRQTTGQETSAGGTAMDTAVLAGGLPPGFDPSIWAHGSYPHLINLGPQDTTPSTPVLPPLSPDDQTQTPGSQSIVVTQLTSDPTFASLAATDPLVIPPPAPQTQPRQQQQQQQTNAQTNRIPGQIDAGPGRLFVLPLNETRIVANEVVLQLPCNVSQPALAAVTRETRLSVVGSQCLGTSGLAVYRMQIGSGQTIASVIRALVAHRIVAVAQANYTYALTQEPTPAGQTEPDLSGQSREGDAAQYVLDKLHLTQIHRVVKGTNVKIAVIDSEIDASHPDIKDSIIARFDATGAEDKPHPHGTGMAGAIVAHTRLMGIAPGARIAAIHAFGSGASAESTTFNILKGLDWAANNGVRIINMSFAGPRDPSLERAIKVAHDKGIVLIAAAGNAGPRSPPLYPAADPNVIAVTATDIDNKLFRGANRGRYIAIAAPGVDILVPAPENAYQMTTGTSVATANISGVVALLLERNPQLKPEDIRKILAASAKRLGPNNEFGAGLVDPAKALELAAPRSAAVPAPTTGR